MTHAAPQELWRCYECAVLKLRAAGIERPRNVRCPGCNGFMDRLKLVACAEPAQPDGCSCSTCHECLSLVLS